jgi:hypothetical protein
MNSIQISSQLGSSVALLGMTAKEMRQSENIPNKK